MDTIEIQLNNLLYNDDFDKNKLFKYVYNYSLNIQKEKGKNIRSEVVNIYNNILEKVKLILIEFTKNIEIKMKNEHEILEFYCIQSNLYIKNINIINTIFNYINNELLLLTDKYTPINYNTFGLEIWINNIIFNNNDIFNKIIIYHLDYDNLIPNTNIDLLNDFMDTIFLCMHKKIIDETVFYNYIGNVILDYITNKLIEFSEKSYGSNKELIETIEQINHFYTNSLNILNLEILEAKYIINFKKRILYKFSDLMKIELNTILNSSVTDNIKLLTKIINYCNDYKYIKTKLNEYFTKTYNSYTHFNDILDVFYLTNMIYEEFMKIEYIVYYRADVIEVKNIFKDTITIAENYDKYIRTFVYKNKVNINHFCTNLCLYFKKYEENELVIVYYKKYLIKRLYKYNFNDYYIKKEIDIIKKIEYIWNTNKSILFKLNIIANDLLSSQSLSYEFNSIYNNANNITITTDGMWNLLPVNRPFSNNNFNNEYNVLRENFTIFFNCKYSNKKLDWNNDISSCILNYYINDSDTIEITCSLKIANILYDFNNNNSISKQNNISKYLEHYKIVKEENNVYILNDDLDIKNINIKFLNSKKKKLKKKSNNEIVFTQKELLEAFVVRLLKKKKIIDYDNMLSLIQNKYDLTNEFIDSSLNKLVDNSYIKKETTNYIYLE